MKSKIKNPNRITLAQARKVLEVVDSGLSHGLGVPEPGKMCVEAAVCFALGQTHGDEPACVNAAVRSFKIILNDSAWSSPKARADGMRKLAIAQLGTNDPSFNEQVFAETLALETVRQIVPLALRAAIKLQTDSEHAEKLTKCAADCDGAKDLSAARYAASAASDAASAASAASAARAARAASYAASAARYAARYAASAASYAARAASDAASAAASAAASYAARDGIFKVAAEIGIQALRVAGAAGIALMDKLIKA